MQPRSEVPPTNTQHRLQSGGGRHRPGAAGCYREATGGWKRLREGGHKLGASDMTQQFSRSFMKEAGKGHHEAMGTPLQQCSSHPRGC